MDSIDRIVNRILSTGFSIDGPLLTFMIVLVVLSSFFSAMETAFSSIKMERLHVYAEQNKKGARLALRSAENFDKTLSTILVGNNLVNIALATLAVRFFATFITSQSTADLTSTLVMTAVILMFGEIFPKSMAKRYPDGFVLRAGFIIYYLSVFLTPITYFFSFIKRVILRDKGIKEKPLNEAELNILLDSMEEGGIIQEDEVELIQSVLDLNDRTVSDIMIPRIDMIAIYIGDDIAKIKKVFFDSRYSRIPVYDEDKDDIIGILYERDFFTKLLKNQKVNVKNIMRPVKYVSKSMKVDALIRELKKAKMHMAIVSGEYGDTAGLVTMEDALEEIVGEIYDEHDDLENDKLIRVLSDNEYWVDADIEIDDLFEELRLGKEPDTQYSKLSGWLYELVEDIPEIGDIATYESIFNERDEDEDEYIEQHKILEFKISDVEERRIKAVILKVSNKNDEDDTA